MDARALLAEKIKKQRMWDNPRFSKKIYGSLKGRQNSIEKEQYKELEKKEYASEEEKKAALEEIKSRAMVKFTDFEETPDALHSRLNEKPREAVLDMTERLDYLGKEKMTSAFTDYVQDEIHKQFVQRNGMTMDEYQNAMRQQLEADREKRLAEADKSDNFPPLMTDNTVNVEKLDDQNALLHVGVGAPVSKKNKK